MSRLRRLAPDASRSEAAVLAAVTLLALVLRLWGTGFGLPYRYHPDENQYVEDALGFLDGDLNPGRLNNPTLHKTLLAAQYVVLGPLVGWPADADDDEGLAPFYRLGRLNSVFFGTAAVPLLWWLGRRAYGRTVGLLAAAWLAVAFMPVRESHFATNDASVTFLVVLGLGLLLGVPAAGGRARSVGAGVVAGLAAATKYTGAVLAVPLCVAHLWPEAGRCRPNLRRPAVAGLLLALAAMAAAFLIGSPFTVLDPSLFWQDMVKLVNQGRHGYKGQILDPDGGYVFFLKSLRWGMGPALLALALAGLARAVVRPSRADAVLASFVLVLYVHQARQLMFFARFLLPAVPLLLLLAARLLEEVVARAVPLRSGRNVALAGLAAALALPGAVSAVRFDYLMSRTDTRTLAARWVQANVPPGSSIVTEPYGPPLDRRAFAVQKTDTEGLAWHDQTVESYRLAGVTHLVTSSFVFDRRYRDPEQARRLAAFYASLDTQAELLAEFRPHRTPDRPPFVFTQVYGPVTDLSAFHRPGPLLRVYRLAAE